MEERISPRHEVAIRIADFVSDNRLCNPFGGDVSKSTRKGRPIYVVLFSIPRSLDGVVEVYSPTFIRIVTQGAAEMPASVFENVEDALEFMRLAWVEYDRELALAVPVKKAKG